MALKLFPPKPGRTPYWLVRGTLHGQSIFASTKARDKASARRFKSELEVRLAQSAGRNHRAATFQEAAALYIKDRCPRDVECVKIARLCAVIGDHMLSDIRQHVLISAARAIYPKCSPETQNRMALTPAATILHFAADNDLCPYIRVKKLKEKQPEPRSIRKEDATRLIESADGKMKLLLVFLFSQGWRISDALRLKWQDIDFNEATVHYHVSKTDEWKTVPLHAAVLGMLRNEGAAIGFVFPWRNKSNLYRDLAPLCKKTGVLFTPHMARHSFATWLLNEGVSVKDIMEAGGWKSHNSVMRYISVDEKRVRATINRLLPKLNLA